MAAWAEAAKVSNVIAVDMAPIDKAAPITNVILGNCLG
jgi:hypothetical protein